MLLTSQVGGGSQAGVWTCKFFRKKFFEKFYKSEGLGWRSWDSAEILKKFCVFPPGGGGGAARKQAFGLVNFLKNFF